MAGREEGGVEVELDRRRFVYSLAALAFAPPRILTAGVLDEEDAERGTLSDRERESLEHFCEQIVPADEYPGARELGVAAFIDRVLKEAHPEWRSIYHAGLLCTDSSARELYGRPFVEITVDQQTRLLERMERGELPRATWGALLPGEFFSMIRSHTMQGYYGHPQWGGNRGKAAWKMIGYDDFWT